jgi:hypothetical protein
MFSKAIEKMGTYSFIGLKTLKSLKSMCFFFFFFFGMSFYGIKWEFDVTTLEIIIRIFISLNELDNISEMVF